jgi:predicted MPP superfamily phosphohydrolase
MKKLIALILTVVMVFSLVNTAVFAIDFKKGKTESVMDFAVISDMHFYPSTLMSDSDAWHDYCENNIKLFPQSEAMIRTAIETALKRNPELKYILVPGDLTKDGEYEAHRALAVILEEYEEKYNIDFFVTTGNHDINQQKSTSFASGKQESTRSLQYNEFAEVYKNLGYDLAFSRYNSKGDKIQNGLSYAGDLKDNNGKTGKYNNQNYHQACMVK